MLALLSRASIHKPNPQGEWLKGMAIGRSLKIDDFVVPLNTDGLTPEELPWNLHPINYISFTPSWASGLAALTKKLESVNAPRILDNGSRLVKESIAFANVIQQEPETLLSNCFRITQLPHFIYKYKSESGMSKHQRHELRAYWACRDVSSTIVYAFGDPPFRVQQRHKLRRIKTISWTSKNSIDGIDTRDFLIGLVRSCIRQLLAAKGFSYCKEARSWYLPQGHQDRDRVLFKVPAGRSSWFKGVGERRILTTHGPETYRYHISPSFDILRNIHGSLVLVLRSRVYLTDASGTPLRDRKLVSRRKHLCKYWFNEEWCVRILGIAQLLADEDMVIRFGSGGKQQLTVDACPISPVASHTIADERVDEIDETYIGWHEDDAVTTDTTESNVE